MSTLQVAFAVTLFTVLFVLAVIACPLLIAWRNRAVQRALVAEQNRQTISRLCASMAEGEKRYGLRQALHSVWEHISALSYALHGTTQQIEADLWKLCLPKPSMEIPECYRPFYIELQAIARALDHLGTLNDSAHIEYGDVAFYRAWVEDLEARFRQFEADTAFTQRRLHHQLAETRALYTEIGMAYYAARCNPAYEAFPGMLHVVELLVEESGMPAEQLKAYVVALTKQLSMLVASFEKAIIEDEAPVWIYSYYDRCPHLQAFLAGLEPSIS